MEPRARAGIAVVGVAFVAVCVLVATLTFYAGRGCSSSVEIPETGIDAGPGEAAIAERLDGSVQAAAARLEEIEREHAAEIAAFDAAQRAKYEQLRNDEEAAARFIADFNRRIREGR